MSDLPDIKYWYAVARGRTRGIYTNWEDARRQTDGYSGMMVKKFLDIQDAAEFMMYGYYESPGYTPPNPRGKSGWARGKPDYYDTDQYPQYDYGSESDYNYN